jgi:hypothetical protein
MKVDGLSLQEKKLQIIAKALPFKAGINVDSKEVIDARYEAACELLRTRNKETSYKPATGIKVDSNAIAEKKAKMQNVYFEGGNK